MKQPISRHALLHAFSDVDAELVEDALAERKPKRRTALWVRAGALAAGLLLAVGIGVYGINRFNRRTGETPSGLPDGSPSGIRHLDNEGSQSRGAVALWETTRNGGEIRAHSTGTVGQSITLLSNNRTATEISADENEVFTVLFGQWMHSQVNFDYSMQFALFQPEIVESTFTKQIKARGLTYEEALENITENTRHFLLFGETTLTFDITSCRVPNEDEMKNWHMTCVDTRFSDAGLDPGKISDCRVCTFSDLTLRLGEELCRTFSEPEIPDIWFYRYEGVWYVSPEKIEDDLSVDFALADKDNGGFFKITEGTGVVKWIHGSYIRIDDFVLYLQDINVAANLQIGDSVTFSTYRFSMPAIDLVSKQNEEVWACRTLSLQKTS